MPPLCEDACSLLPLLLWLALGLRFSGRSILRSILYAVSPRNRLLGSTRYDQGLCRHYLRPARVVYLINLFPEFIARECFPKWSSKQVTQIMRHWRASPLLYMFVCEHPFRDIFQRKSVVFSARSQTFGSEASLVDADRPFSAARHANRGYSPDDVVQLHTIDIADIFMELVNGLIVRHFVKLDTLGCLTVGNRPLASNLIT